LADKSGDRAALPAETKVQAGVAKFLKDLMVRDGRPDQNDTFSIEDSGYGETNIGALIGTNNSTKLVQSGLRSK